MASYTPYYNLKKPADADSYDIADANGNMDLIDAALNAFNDNISCLDDAFTTTQTTGLTVSIKNGTGSFRNNTIRYAYNDKYLMLQGAVRINSFARTGSNPGISATLPVSVERVERYDAIMTTASQKEYATTFADGTGFQITVSESTTNYSNSDMTIIIPRIVFKRS